MTPVILALASTFTLPDGTQWILAALGALWMLSRILGKGETTTAVHAAHITELRASVANVGAETKAGLTALGAKLDTLLERHGGTHDPEVMRRDIDELRLDVDGNTDRIGAIELGCAAEGASLTESATHVKGTTGQHAAVGPRPRKVTTP